MNKTTIILESEEGIVTCHFDLVPEIIIKGYKKMPNGELKEKGMIFNFNKHPVWMEIKINRKENL